MPDPKTRSYFCVRWWFFGWRTCIHRHRGIAGAAICRRKLRSYPRWLAEVKETRLHGYLPKYHRIKGEGRTRLQTFRFNWWR